MRVLAGRYRLEEIVGRGGSAVVHRGLDSTLKRPVAVKLFSPYRPQAGDFAAAVLREARTAAKLSHPNVARVYDYGEVVDGDERTPYLVMELIDGETLADRLAVGGALEWHRAVEICAAVAAALAAAHEQDSVHRDVKPRNIMLSRAGVKVLDFGIAAAAGQSSFDTGGRLWGTPAYLAPEQLRGEPAFPAADVYALGLLLFECLTGKPAWKGETVGEILASRHDRVVPPLPRIAGLPREIARLYHACTTAEPHRRPTATSAADILHRAAGTPPVLRRAVTNKQVAIAARPARRRRRTALVASAAVATAILSVAGLQFANAASTPGNRKAETAVEATRPAATSPRPSSTSSSPTAEPTETPTAEPTVAPTHWVPVAIHTTVPARHHTTGPAKPTRPVTTPPRTAPSTPSPSPSGHGASPSATPTGSPSPTASDDPTTSPAPSPTGSDSLTTSAAASDDSDAA